MLPFQRRFILILLTAVGRSAICLDFTVLSLNMLFGKVLKYTALVYSSPLASKHGGGVVLSVFIMQIEICDPTL